MRFFRWALMIVLLGILGAALYQTLLWLGVWGNPTEAQVKPLDHEDQEIALIEPATNMDDWGRLVSAIELIKKDWPKINPTLPSLQISLKDAFPRLTTDVPEIVLSLSANPEEQLRLRWYKISGENDAASWVRLLKKRSRPPLAIIGGGTSDRAATLADVLTENYPSPESPSPVFLITTATAEKTARNKPLIEVYQGRSFRFSFTNQKMVEALLRFIEHRHYDPEQAWWAQNLWVHKPANTEALVRAVASMAGVGNLWNVCGTMRRFPHLQPFTMHAIAWQDERYSLDMTSLFEQEFKKRNPFSEFYGEDTIRYGVGEFYQPAPQEQYAVGTFLERRSPVTPHSFLVLPTQSVRMRRVLINLRQRSPFDARNLVILNGDAISFNTIFRDRDVLWNNLDLPYSLVFFAHRNPIDHDAGFAWTREEQTATANAASRRTTTATHDLLLYRDLFEALIYASYDQGRLLEDPLKIRQRLQATRWHLPPLEAAPGDIARVCNALVDADVAQQRPFFDKSGNRQSHTGEHIVWVKPKFVDDRVYLTSKISVWTTRPDQLDGAWQLVEHFGQEEIAP